MPGIAIQTGFPLAGTSTARKAPPASDDRFSHALHERPKAPVQADRKPGEAPKAGAADNSDATHETAPHDNGDGDKVGQSAHAKEDRREDKDESEDGKKDKDGTDAGTLPPHMMAERALARQWSGSGEAATAKEAAAAAPTTASVQAPSTGANGTAQPGAAALLPMQGLPAQPPAAGPAAGKDGGTGTAAPVQPNPAGVDPALEGVSAIATTTADAGKTVPDSTSTALMAKIAASHHETGPGGSPQRAGGAAPISAPDTKPAASQILQASAGQGSGNADPNADGQEDGGNDPSNKAAQNAAQPAAGAKGDTAATPLPTAQMVPSSGSAASFAATLQQGGALARYAANAAAALAAGTPVNALPIQSLSIQLRPVELGSVTAHLKYAGSGLTIDIQVETPEAHRRLSNDSSDIIKSLQSLGFQVDKVTVRQTLAQTQSQAQAQGQPMARDGSAGGFANQGGSPFSMSGQSGGSGHRQGSESGYENASERGIDMVRETADRVSRRGVFI
ncbi:MAG: flagellar hook-length control protein FliK [Hyphomicrobiales bacterium]|nr:flagellar hook-length control protein FliK [Hyphomicrobiales bacterium]